MGARYEVCRRVDGITCTRQWFNCPFSRFLSSGGLDFCNGRRKDSSGVSIIENCNENCWSWWEECQALVFCKYFLVYNVLIGADRYTIVSNLFYATYIINLFQTTYGKVFVTSSRSNFEDIIAILNIIKFYLKDTRACLRLAKATKYYCPNFINM